MSRMGWSVNFLNERVQREFEDLPKDIAARFQQIFKTVEDEGPAALTMPNAAYIRNAIWEFRAKGKDGIARGLFVSIKNNSYVILRFFVKKTRKTPPHEIRLAEKRLQEVQND